MVNNEFGYPKLSRSYLKCTVFHYEYKYIYTSVCETVSVDTFNKILILVMILNDATMWYDCIHI